MNNGLGFKKSTHLSTVLYLLLCGLISAVSVWAAIYGVSDWSDRVQREFWNQIGVVSLLLIIGSVFVWLLKKKIINVKQNDRGALLWANSSVIKRLREAHISLGWLAFDLGLGHSLYFMVNLPNRMNRVYSGVIVLVAMIALIITGLMYKHKTVSLKTIKKSHLLISGIFGVLLMAHV
ncbi:MAG: hypothetical protein P4L49_14645 [Desulfosporosinus sp.]|nr:hypothetical protein [Desulfosporosinus sp.]